MSKARKLLAVVELGGYPNFSELYRQAGYTVTMVTSVRRALAAMKKELPDVVVAEFNFQSDFRDRSSSLETLMAPLQRQSETKIIVFYEKEYAPQFERFRTHFSVHAALTYPIDPSQLQQALEVDSP